jgi:type VI secretion system secreted protein VgrG
MLEKILNFLNTIIDAIVGVGKNIDEIDFDELIALIDKWDFDSRPLNAHEISEAKKVFGDNLDYDDIMIIEEHALPNFIDDIGRVIKKMPKRKEYIKNAITLGNRCIFGRDLETEKTSDMSWMIHELTHAWQYQTLNWLYLVRALDAQLELKDKVYDFGGEDGLKSRRKDGASLNEFNMEQQGDIAKKYYLRLVEGRDTSAFDPYIQEIQS